MITRSTHLRCTPARAFALFTERASDWWPESLRHSADPRSTISLVAGGRFWERSHDGDEIELGRVLTWEPAHRLILDFYPGTDPEHPTAVEITFAAEGDGTRIVIEHRPKPESAALWDGRAERFAQAWSLMLPALADAASS